MLIVIAVWDTLENQSTWMTRETLISLMNRVDWRRHRLIISDNGSCQATQDQYAEFAKSFPFRVIQNGENIGTARAVNRGWSYRSPGEHVVKMDNDVVIHQSGWADQIEEVFQRDPVIGICGLKRKDLIECPDHPEPGWRSRLRMLPHKPGERWIIVEECGHIMGTCQAYSSALIDKIGYLYQGDWKYGFDDSLAGVRANVAGFRLVFLPHIEIDHIDPGGND